MRLGVETRRCSLRRSELHAGALAICTSLALLCVTFALLCTTFALLYAIPFVVTNGHYEWMNERWPRNSNGFANGMVNWLRHMTFVSFAVIIRRWHGSSSVRARSTFVSLRVLLRRFEFFCFPIRIQMLTFYALFFIVSLTARILLICVYLSIESI